MANRAQRRAKNGAPNQSTSRSHGGMIDEGSLQDKSLRLKEGRKGAWKPTSSEMEKYEEVAMGTDPSDFDPPRVVHAPHSVRNWFRLCSWVLIVCSAIAFFVLMWIPSIPLWSIILVAALLAVGVISLFFDAGDPKDNPNLDQNGTAV
ncbi:MAG: tripartite tricarboxylate transporter TctB family protein [Bifidobacterium sp.]|nr:tripartite tricarboxylate transporter TctB family protein [Bifidobacterium sp.]